MRKLLLAALALSPLAAAADPAEDAVLARQGYFKLLGAEMGVLAAMAKGEAPFDAAKAEAAGKDLVALTSYSLGDLFITGTEEGAAPVKTAALPEIWMDMAAFSGKFDALRAAVAEAQPMLASADTIGAGLGKIGGTCKSCHDDFRAK